ncbi:hypothetical protein [Flavobacterium sp.]|uniref:hypothetical protein n=1 Tax=Flavobacterium sp. TaxID=239 RepID=UPI00260DAF90|nr:hypothetical protein [Flavobacterium sp.]
MKKILLLLIIIPLFSCNREKADIKTETKKTIEKKTKVLSELSYQEQINIIKNSTSKDSVLSNDINFINDTLLKGKFKLSISKYEVDNEKNNCYPIRISKKVINEFYNEELENLGDLNNDKKDDFAFYLHSLNYCEQGDSYYFTDNNIPRIETESTCCHSKSLFSIGDIDEDGGNEIGQFYSSCTSQYKSIFIWTLKKGKWVNVARFSHVLNDEYKIPDNFNKLYKKISKGKFKFLEISDINAKGELQKEWKTIVIK